VKTSTAATAERENPRYGGTDGSQSEKSVNIPGRKQFLLYQYRAEDRSQKCL
jgi:hypothetical protein